MTGLPRTRRSRAAKYAFWACRVIRCSLPSPTPTLSFDPPRVRNTAPPRRVLFVTSHHCVPSVFFHAQMPVLLLSLPCACSFPVSLVLPCLRSRSRNECDVRWRETGRLDAGEAGRRGVDWTDTCHEPGSDDASFEQVLADLRSFCSCLCDVILAFLVSHRMLCVNVVRTTIRGCHTPRGQALLQRQIWLTGVPKNWRNVEVAFEAASQATGIADLRTFKCTW